MKEGAQVIGDCLSGRELIDTGFAQDVELAVQLDASSAAPVLRDGRYCDGGVQVTGSK